MEKVGDESLALEAERLLEYFGEEESKTKKTKTSESGGASKASASPSEPATSEDTAPRGGGGAPMAAGS